MAGRIRALDWSQSAIGARDGWAPELRSAIDLMLASPMVSSLTVGPARVFLYNDAAAAVYGDRHPGVLGQPMAAAFAEEFHTVAAFYDRAFAGESAHVPAQALDPANRGAPEIFDAYVIPVRDVAGAVIAVYAPSFAIGERLRAEAGLRDSENERRAGLERRIDAATAELEANRDLLKGTIDSSDDMIQVFEAIRDPTGEIVDFGWILNNRTSEERYGEVRGQRLLERNPGVVEDGIFDAFKRVTETGVPEKAERHYVHEQFNGWFFQSVARFGDGVATTTTSIDDWKAAQADILRLRDEAAQARLNESEGRFRTLADTAPAMIWQNDAAGENLFVNQYFLDYTGKSASEISGSQWRALVHPKQADAHVESYMAAVRDRRAWRDRNLIRRHDGAWRWFENFAQPLFGDDGGFRGHVGVSTDIQAAVEAEATLRDSQDRQAFLLALGDRMRAEASADAIIATASRMLGERLRASRIVFAEIDEVAAAARIRPGWAAEGAQVHPIELSLADFGGPMLEDLRAGRIVRCDDVGEPPFARDDMAALYAIGVKAGLSVPLIVNGRFVVNLNVHQHDPRSWTDDEVALVEDVAQRLWDAVKRARAEASLRESEERLRQFEEASQDILWIREPAGLQWTYLTPAFETVYGLSRDDALAGDNYRNWQGLIVPEDREHAVALIERVRAGEWVTFEYRIRRPSDGAVRWLRDTDFPISDAGGDVVLIGGIGHDFTEVRDAELRLQTLVEGMPQLIWRAVDGGDWTWASPQWSDYTGQNQVDYQNRGWLEALHPDDRGRALAAWEHASEQGGFQVEYRLRRRRDGEYRWFQTRAAPVRDRGGAIIEWLGTSTDIQDLRELQGRQQVLLHELQHRVRNILAVLRSISSRTGETSDTVEEFAAHLEGRLSALARTQMVLMGSPGGGADLESMVREELLAQTAGEDQIDVDGPDIQLPPKAAEVLALALHELATNATKYGALSSSLGRITVRWEIATVAGEAWLRLYWSESGVRVAAMAPRRNGFGTELITVRVPYELRGKGELTLRPGGLHAEIAFPMRISASILQTSIPA